MNYQMSTRNTNWEESEEKGNKLKVKDQNAFELLKFNHS